MNPPINIEDYSESPISMLKRHCSMFLYGSTGIPELITNRVAQDFFSFALLHLTCTMFLTSDSNNDNNCGIFHRVLDPIGKSVLLNKIDELFETSVGKTTLKEFIKLRRNRLATHRSLSIKELPQENLEVSFYTESLNQYYQAMNDLVLEVSNLYDELDQIKN